VVDCDFTLFHDCNGGLSPDTTIDPTLPIAQRRLYLESLRDYVPKIAAWGNPRLSTQLARVLDGVAIDLYRSERAKAAAATGTTNGLVFAYLLTYRNGGPEIGKQQAHAWLEQAVRRIDQPWQAQWLALSCDAPDPACTVAIQRFRELDPDNAAAWLMGLPDTPGERGDRLLLRAVQAPRFDHHEADFLDAAMAFATRLIPNLPAEARIAPADFALEIWNRVDKYAYKFKYNPYCGGSLAARNAPAIENACLAIVGKIQTAMKPWLGDEFGPATLTFNLSHNPVEQAQAARRYRNARWIYSTWKQLPPGSEPDAATHFRAIRDYGELAYLKSLVASAHLPLEAPAEFVTVELHTWPRHASTPAQAGK
jgi:hypothetical protein